MEQKTNRNSDVTEVQYKNIMEANIKLMDKIKWIKEDIERLMYKIEEDYSKEMVIEELKKILKNNN